MSNGMYAKQICAVFSIDSSFLGRWQLFIGTVGAWLSFRALLRYVTVTLSPLNVTSEFRSKFSLSSRLI